MSNILIKPLTFPSVSDKPFFYTSYVSTIDGKIYVKKPGYWPIGSKNDFEFFIFLRAHADVIIEGKNTALAFGAKTLKTIHSEKFLAHRKKLKKEKQVEYMVITRTPDETLAKVLKNEYNYKSTIITSSVAPISEQLKDVANIEQLTVNSDNNLIPSLVDYLANKKYKNVFLDVGSELLAGFIKEDALDDLFLTIAPKIYGEELGETVSLGENKLFFPDQIPTFTLISCEQIDDEIFLRYRKNN